MRRRTLLKSLAGAAAAATLPAWPSGLDSLRSVSAAPDNAGQASIKGTHLNQLGYQAKRFKQASVVVAPGFAGDKPTTFSVRNEGTGSPAFTAALSAPKQDETSGDLICSADFSALKTPGRYWIDINGQRSETFNIAENVYADALRLTTRAFYGQRCGCAVDLGSGYAHAACHASSGYHTSSGRAGGIKNSGGWHDAGDYGRYVVNSGITTGTLLWAWELYPDALAHLHLGIPESGRRMPDFLAEVRWNLAWMLSMQDEDGGVWHKETSEHFCAFILPEADTLPSVVIGTGTAPFKSTGATADLAAVMAIAARCYRPFDATFAQQCLVAARKAYAWASAHSDVLFRNPSGITTGEYGDNDCKDELLWAAAELFRTTGESAYEHAFLAAIQPSLPNLFITTPSWNSVASLALWTYCLSGRGTSAAADEAIRKVTHAAASARVQRSAESGYGHTLAPTDYIWGSNSVAANDAMLLLLAHRLQPELAHVEAALSNLHYLFGRNCFGVSWITGLGMRPFQHPHHRPSAADHIAAPWPGLLSAGPNAHGGDPVADALPRQAPMRMWVDDERAYALNEVAINWNAPLVFMLAAANSRHL